MAKSSATKSTSGAQAPGGAHTGITDEVRAWKAEGKTSEEARVELKSRKKFSTSRISQLMKVFNESSRQQFQVAGDGPQLGDSILVLQQQWLSHILDGSKVLEIRSVNKRPCDVFLAMSGTQTLYGKAHLGQAFRIETDEQWRELQGQHLVPNRLRLYGGRTHGIPLSNVRRIAPVRYKTKHGAVGFVKFAPIDGPDVIITRKRPAANISTFQQQALVQAKSSDAEPEKKRSK